MLKMSRWAALALVGALAGLGGGLAPIARAASLPGSITPLPNPPGAPERDVFLVTLPHSHAVPYLARFTFTDSQHQRVTATAGFRKMNNPYQYETAWSVPKVGHLEVQAYTRHHHLLAEGNFHVTKAHTSVVGRVGIGALFIGGSLWLWYRQQRFYRRKD